MRPNAKALRAVGGGGAAGEYCKRGPRAGRGNLPRARNPVVCLSVCRSGLGGESAPARPHCSRPGPSSAPCRWPRGARPPPGAGRGPALPGRPSRRVRVRVRVPRRARPGRAPAAAGGLATRTRGASPTGKPRNRGSQALHARQTEQHAVEELCATWLRSLNTQPEGITVSTAVVKTRVCEFFPGRL